MSEAKSETDLCVCIVSNCSRHQSSSSSVAIACDNELSSLIREDEFQIYKTENNIPDVVADAVTLEKFGAIA